MISLLTQLRHVIHYALWTGGRFKPVRCRVLCRLGTDCVITLLQIPPEMFVAYYIYLPSLPIDILLFRRSYTQMLMSLLIKTSKM